MRGLTLTHRERRRLIIFATNLGSAALNHLATIAHLGTIRRWIREAASKKSALQKRKTGHLRTSVQIEKLILKLASENSWGYCRLNALKTSGIKIKRTAIRSTNMVVNVERIIQTIQQEVFDQCMILGRTDMNVHCSQFREHHHLERPHQDLGKELIERPQAKESNIMIEEPGTIRLSDMRFLERFSGFLKSYSRKAA